MFTNSSCFLVVQVLFLSGKMGMICEWVQCECDHCKRRKGKFSNSTKFVAVACIHYTYSQTAPKSWSWTAEAARPLQEEEREEENNMYLDNIGSSLPLKRFTLTMFGFAFFFFFLYARSITGCDDLRRLHRKLKLRLFMYILKTLKTRLKGL